MAIANTIRIDLDGQKDIQAGVSLSTGDTNAYGLVLEFYKDGAFYDITGYNLAIYARRSGAVAPIPDVGTVQNGKGYYVIKPSMYAYAGETQIELVLTDSIGMSFVSKVLHFNVHGGFSTTATVSETDYSVLGTLIQQAQAAVTNANSAADYANEKALEFSEFMQGGTTVKNRTTTGGEIDDMLEEGYYNVVFKNDAAGIIDEYDLFVGSFTRDTTDTTHYQKITELDEGGDVTEKARTGKWEYGGTGSPGGIVWGDWKPVYRPEQYTYSENDYGIPGQMAFDNNYFYICTAPNTWIRFAKTAW